MPQPASDAHTASDESRASNVPVSLYVFYSNLLLELLFSALGVWQTTKPAAVLQLYVEYGCVWVCVNVFLELREAHIYGNNERSNVRHFVSLHHT